MRFGMLQPAQFRSPQGVVRGFSLVELLICLAILGVLTALTIPQLFQTPASSQTKKYNAMAKDAALMIVSAYEQYRAANSSVPTTMRAADLTPYLNYVSQMSSGSQIDAHANSGGTASNCAGTTGTQQGLCYKLHNGAALWADTSNNFGGSTTLNAVYFRFDPNATYEGAVNTAPGMGMQIALYYDGFVRSRGTLRASTTTYDISGAHLNYTTASGTEDPAWFAGF